MTFSKRRALGAATLLCTTALLSPMSASAVTITESEDAFALANALFLNTGGLVINGTNIATGPQLSGQPGQSGIYQNASGTYGLPASGIVLSTGFVSDYADGPNESTSTTGTFGQFILDDDGGGDDGGNGGGDGGPGYITTFEQEALLQPITGQDFHYDVVELTVEFFAATPAETVTFFGTFGSEEFPEFVNSSFNDGFGLFVNGQNYAGVLADGGDPNAELPPVNVNHPDTQDIPGTQLDGVIAPGGNPVLRFDVPINPGELNTFKVILADASDDSLDSTVYLSSFFAEPGGGGNNGGGPVAVNTGLNEFDPLLPDGAPDQDTGAFTITLPDDLVDGDTIWIDPPVTVGYEYAVDSGALFTSITAPSLATVGDLDGYIITINGIETVLPAGGFLDLGTGVSSFMLTGIDPSLMLDPANPLAFPLGVSFSNFTQGTQVTLTPITDNTGGGGVPVVPLPAGMPLYVGALAIGAFVSRRKRRKA